jgi:hypothetical protein
MIWFWLLRWPLSTPRESDPDSASASQVARLDAAPAYTDHIDQSQISIVCGPFQSDEPSGNQQHGLCNPRSRDKTISESTLRLVPNSG